jgi:hypothetical protein
MNEPPHVAEARSAMANLRELIRQDANGALLAALESSAETTERAIPKLEQWAAEAPTPEMRQEFADTAAEARFWSNNVRRRTAELKLAVGEFR